KAAEEAAKKAEEAAAKKAAESAEAEDKPADAPPKTDEKSDKEEPATTDEVKEPVADKPADSTKDSKASAAAETASETAAKSTPEPADDAPKLVLPPKPIDPLEAKLRAFQELVAGDDKLQEIETDLRNAFVEIERQGFFDKPQHSASEGNQAEITIQPQGDPSNQFQAKVPDLLYEQAKERLKEQIAAELERQVALRGFLWLSGQLDAIEPRTTLRLNDEQTKEVQELAAKNVKPVTDDYDVGSGRPLAKANVPIGTESLELLRLEYAAQVENLTAFQMLFHLLAALGMYVALYTLCGLYIYIREPTLLKQLSQFGLMLGCVTVTVAMSVLLARWESEIIIILIFGMCMALAYQRELALLLTSAVGLLVVISLGQSLGNYVTLMASAATVILMLGRVRSRSKLIYVGLAAGAVAFLTDVGVSTLENQPLGLPLVEASAWMGLRAMMAAAIMAVILPLVEKIFGVQTDLSLLELGDQSHPLLQELVRRAPGTYNHSINVASIAEAAAESIGAHGLLCR
ncbi:MAG: hypothetical protein MI757_08170, partial [Pirellulales bacterium]|nr:hypothetical protein [Pirellulales bacterium]